MKKYIVVGLIIVVGVVLLIMPLFKDNVDTVDPVEKNLPAVFTFKDNLATLGEEVVELEIEVNKPLQEVRIIYNDSTLEIWTSVKENIKYSFSAGMFGVGTRTLQVLSTLEDGSEFVDNRFVRVLSDIIPEKLNAKIKETYPHNPQSFTQGLEFWSNRLFEGTGDPGNQGKTIVAEVKLENGEHLTSMGLEAGYFGEGITIFDGMLYQLTYKNGKCFKYSVGENLQIVDEYNYQGEGWGLCNDGQYIIMSNGSERLVYRDPESFTTVKTIEVYNDKGPIINLNELEYIDGKIYANVWTTNMVVVIEPTTGKVLQEIDATELMREGRGAGEVLNGIAYNQTTGKIYMTGKYWNKLFEVKFESPGV